MAKKGQKFRKYTNEEREKITQEVIERKETLRSAGEKYDISWKTIGTWVSRYKKEGKTQKEKPKVIERERVSEIEKLRLENEILKKYQ